MSGLYHYLFLSSHFSCVNILENICVSTVLQLYCVLYTGSKNQEQTENLKQLPERDEETLWQGQEGLVHNFYTMLSWVKKNSHQLQYRIQEGLPRSIYEPCLFFANVCPCLEWCYTFVLLRS